MQSPPNLISLPLDGERVRRVCLNLLDHALDRSSPGGWITLRVEATLEEFTFTLADNGRPMPAEVWAGLPAIWATQMVLYPMTDGAPALACT